MNSSDSSKPFFKGPVKISDRQYDGILMVKIGVSDWQQYDFTNISEVIHSEVKLTKSIYINILFVDQLDDILEIETNENWEDKHKHNYVKEIIFNNQTTTHNVIYFISEVMKIIPKAYISEAVFNGFDNKTLNDIFQQTFNHLTKINWLRIENAKELDFKTLQQLKDNSIVSKS